MSTERTYDPIEERHEQAAREAGVTAIGRFAAAVTAVLFLLTIVLVPVVDLVRDAGHPGSPFAALADGWSEALDRLDAATALAANRALLGGLERFEDRVEETSLLRERLLPPVQLASARWLGLGNEQAYLGRDGWLYYRADFEHAVGPGFLSPTALEAERLADRQQASLRIKDPRPALERFAAQLKARGIALLVVPVPVKPQIEPGRFSARYGPTAGSVANPSRDELMAWLAERQIDVLDPAPLLVSAKRATGEPQYLATDTHWTPAAMERVAEELARRVAAAAGWQEPGLAGYEERPVVVEGPGDIATMLNLPAGQSLYPPQSVRVRRVLTWEGTSWRPDHRAEVLLLGDSFTNVYSEPGLGFGSGAGLAERLAFHVQRPVDRIARNAGGAHASRQALIEALRRQPDRLAPKRVVVYQFASRELSQGDWKVLELP